MSKAAKTKQFILEKVAPIFNKNGYYATSMSDITSATSLTKGAVYGNFKNKEELALASFDFNVRFIVDKIKDIMVEIDSPLEKLYALTNFYRDYYIHRINFGGCPILNVGIDANFTNPKLFKRVKEVMESLQKSIASVITQGQERKEIKKEIDSLIYGTRIFSLIEGSVFTSVMFKNDKYLLDMMDHLDHLIATELKV